jgi:hypothetical protein
LSTADTVLRINHFDPCCYTTLLRHREENLRRAFFSTRHARVLDAYGYVRFLDWRLYGEEALASREAAVWQQPGSLTLQYGGQMLSSYDIDFSRETGKPKTVGGARLFETCYVLPQLRLFALSTFT